MSFLKKLSYGAAAAALFAVAPAAVHAQQTASQARGVVTGQDGSPVSGAVVTIIHLPTATVSTTTTSANGTFSQSGLRVGGPYRIAVTAEGFDGDVLEDISLAPGQNPTIRVSLRATAAETITIYGTRTETIDLNNGAGSSFTRSDILNQPSYSRDLVNTLLRDPLANSSGAAGNLSIAGVNPRFNALAIDGVLQQDDFGLSNSTYPTARSPISLDTVEAASIAASDYSVFVSGFQGGLVNVVTRSGGNDFTGSLYYYRSGNDYQSNTAFGRYIDSPDFTEEEYGLAVGGPILRDRLFFFVGYEKFTTARPVSFAPNPAAPVLRTLIQNALGYDVGARPDVASIPTESIRWLGRLDWNVNEDHRLSFTYQRTEEVGTANVFAGNYETAWYDTPVEMSIYTLQAYSNWTPNFSTTFRIGYKDFSRGQDCRAGTDVGQIQVGLTPANVVGTPLDGLVTSNFTFIGGCDRSRHANEFTDERWQFFGQGDYTMGDHVISFGANYETYELYNLFVQDALGNFQFTGANAVTNLMNGTAFVTYRGVPSNVRTEGATFMGYDILSLFVQDEWQATPTLMLSGGLRYERYIQDELQPHRPDFVAAYGRSNQNNLDGISIIQPRFSFRWDAADRTTVSGGFGLFSGGDPKVWFSNTYLPQAFTFSGTFNNVDPRVVPQPLLDLVANADPATPAPVDTISPDFEIPSEWRASLRVAHEFDLNFGDFNLGSNYLVEAQVIYSQTRYGYAWRNLAQTDLGLPIGTSPDGRPIYADLQSLNQQPGANFQNATELYNTTEGGGWIYTLSLANEYENGLGFYVSYAYQDIESVNPGSSSVAISNFNGQVDFDRNNPSLFRSDYEVRHKFGLNFSYERNIWADLRSRIDVFGYISSGQPYSFTFVHNALDPMFGRSAIQSPTGQTDLLYVPMQNDPNVIFAPGFNQAAFDAFVERYGLRRGEIAARNTNTAPWDQRWDLRFQQELPFAHFGFERLRGNRATLVLDIQNFPNLLNNEWGASYRTAGAGTGQFFDSVLPVVNASLVRPGDPTRPLNSRASANPGNTTAYDPNFDPSIVCNAPGACVYRFNSFTDPATAASENLGQSLYRIRLGIRYEF
ncbi:MAG: TonB-dependent receptor [Maricaulaceae bacterium]|nr:TonB-dependent receptor [Maricaulaceae bacterium]